MDSKSMRKEPLFVKVEGYKNILQELEAIRQIIENMNEAVEVLDKVRSVKEKSIETFLENVDRLNERLEGVNGQLPEVEGYETHQLAEIPDESPIDDSVQELHGELKDLKKELSELG